MATDNPILSVLVPSRERAEALKFSLDSLGLERNNLDVLVWLDDDEPQIDKYRELFDKDSHIKLFIKPRVGYKNFHVMLNFLASKASGDWLILWNDDAYMGRVEWYDKFIEYSSLSKPKKEPVVYNIWVHGRPGRPFGNAFPIVSVKYFKLLGHIAGNAICDDWIRKVAHYTNIQREIFGIRPHHRKFGYDNDHLGDLTDNISEAFWTNRLLEDRHLGATSNKVLHERKGDIYKIQSWIQASKSRSLKVGFVGLGKLGLPVALAIESKGKNVVAYDINPKVKEYIQKREIPFQEEGSEELLKKTQIEMVDSINKVVKKCDLVFCAVQTPHDQRFEGDKPFKDQPVDFDYSYLKKAVKGIVKAADKLNEKTTLVVISTCLPGTYEQEIKPLISPKVNYIYNPFFIAMGTVISDFLNPEFVLIGNNEGDTTPLTNFYKMVLGADKTCITDITTAEGVKVLYNTYITTKIVFANIYGELAHKLGMNTDDIYKALSLATERIISTKYLQPGVGDGGGCHPRDNIALSYLAKKHKLSFNIFEHLMIAREKHMEWLADIASEESKSSGLPLIILGKAYKPELKLQAGSPAILLANLLSDRGINFEHYEFDYPQKLPVAVYILATQHAKYAELEFPKKSIVIDPFRYISKKDGVKVVSIGGKL